MEFTCLTDAELIEKLWIVMNTPSTLLSIESIQRLPETIEERCGDRPRPFMIKFRDMTTKRKVLENARHLKEYDNWNNQVSIELEKTKQERKRDYELRK